MAENCKKISEMLEYAGITDEQLMAAGIPYFAIEMYTRMVLYQAVGPAMRSLQAIGNVNSDVVYSHLKTQMGIVDDDENADPMLKVNMGFKHR
jgi:hypothetical protein